jgi:hypothetical protein
MSTKIKFEFKANSTDINDTSGLASWHYVDPILGKGIQKTVIQHFNSFEEANNINKVIEIAWNLGESEGSSACKRKILEALKF